jgi:glucokinase
MYLGFDIGGTKCAVVTASYEGDRLKILDKKSLPTDLSVGPYEMLDRLIALADTMLSETPSAIGISSGGPLDAQRGVILSPPNLPGWDEVEIVAYLEGHFGVRAHLLNDADACALAEWRFGAGIGKKHMIFITFGTGFGTGLILDGRLYRGANGNAGEAGHIRMASDGPVGYGKAGSLEGFCSGAGIAHLAYEMAVDATAKGARPSFFPEGATAAAVTAKSVAEAARAVDECALEVYRISGKYLGRGLAVLMDILNPERIVIGSVFMRSRDLLWEAAKAEIEREALEGARSVCEVVPAALGEQIGDFGAIAAALYTEGSL